MKNLSIFLSTLIIFGCTSPQKFFDQKEYDKAYKSALKNLKNNKSAEENTSVLIASLEKIIEREYEKISFNQNSENPSDWDKAFNNIDKLKEKITDSRKFTKEHFGEKFKALSLQEEKIAQKAFGFYKKRGQENLEKYNSTEKKAYAQNAHQDFSKAKKYINEGIALDTLIDQSYNAAVVNILVETKTLWAIMEAWEINRAFDNIEDYSGGYRRIFFDRQINNVDCLMEIEFQRLDFKIDENTNSQDYEKRVIIDYETVTDTAGNESEVPVYGDVEGIVNIITKTKTATWEVRVNINSYTQNCSMYSENFTAQRSSQIREITTSGDERAIPNEYLNPDEEEFEDEDDMAEALIDILYSEIVGYYFG